MAGLPTRSAFLGLGVLSGDTTLDVRLSCRFAVDTRCALPSVSADGHDDCATAPPMRRTNARLKMLAGLLETRQPSHRCCFTSPVEALPSELQNGPGSS